MFKVVPDQLRVSDGWVRCGQCNEVFDANLNLQAPAEEALVSTSLIPPAPTSADSVAIDEEQDNDPFLAVNTHALHFEPEALPDQPVEPRLDAEELVDDVKALQQIPENEEFMAGEGGAEHSFLQPNKTSSVWRRRSFRVVLSVSGLLLGVMLVLQVVLHERDRIAASLPDTKVSLDTLCSVAGCTVSPLRHIEAVVIDSSSFTKVRADVYRLSFSLKNTAHISVATPALELTLTDMLDQPVVRRVFTPKDFGDQSGAMEAGSELSISLPLNVKLAGSLEKISGYRLLSFYP
jgi:predicted Zn finger-like uncharacterized protein